MDGRRRSAALSLLSLALVVPLLLAAPSAHASPPRFVYDALGDSYGSGYGVPPYEECGRSQAAYAAQLDGRMRIELDDFVACAGATTTSLVSGGQLEGLDDDTDLVTVSIGGNDIGWSQAVVACLAGSDEACASTSEAIRTRITDELPAKLDDVYDRIRSAAPTAHVVVTGYPRLFSPEHGAYLGASPAEQEVLNDGADELNRVLRKVARQHRFDFVDVTKRFVGHGVNAPEPWILGAQDPGAFHPNEPGYAAYTAAVTAAVKPARLRHAIRTLVDALRAWLRGLSRP